MTTSTIGRGACRMARRWPCLALLFLLSLTSIASAATYRLRIISATWGVGNKHVDVLSQVQSHVKEGGLHITPNTILFGDPVPGPMKELILVYELNEVRHTEHFMQDAPLSIGAPPVFIGDAHIKPASIEKLHNWARNSPDIKPTDIGVEISRDGCLRSDITLTVPVRIDATVATDSTNIRLYFGDRGMVIFNWELNQQELRYHTPPNGDIVAIGNKGYVSVDTWVHIAWIIEPHRATVLVDGQKRFERAGNYTGLSGTAGVGTHNAALQVTQFDFTPVAPGDTLQPEVPFDRMARMRAPDSGEIPGLLKPIKRPQSEIKALYVQEEPDGDMLGLASELILTATPGEPRGYTPVLFVSPVGAEMHAVLDDVLRSVRVKYPKWAASRVELSFEDRVTPKDSDSMSAAIGTLLLSMLNGFEVDSHVAMTGDLTADGKLRRIGGVAAKIRGATAAQCTVLVLPADNYEQVADAMVFEGSGLITEIQVIGAETVEQATEIARVERKEKLSQAIDAFSSVAALLKKSPERIHAKDVQAQLAHVVELEPNHISAKLLLLQSQNKEPKKLSATASLYYTFLPVRTMMPMLFDTRQPGRPTNLSPLMIQQGLVSLRKLRARVDPKIYPTLDAMIEYVQMVDAVNNGKRTPEDLEPRRRRLVDSLNRLQTDRALMEKMLHEGI